MSPTDQRDPTVCPHCEEKHSINLQDFCGSMQAEAPDDRDVDEDPYCWTCYNSGYVVTCPDDLCQNNGRDPGDRCIHGDGEIPCPDCDASEWL